MAKGYKSNYGYASSARANNVQLPEVIPCGRCEKKKGHNCFAKKRLDELKEHISKKPGFNAAVTPWASCMMCTGAQQLELFCQGCDRTLPNTSFNKTQRRNPDNARCEKCMRKKLAHEPGAGSDDDDSGHECLDDGSDDYDDGGATLASHASTLSIGDSSGGVSFPSNSISGAGGYGGNVSNARAPSASDGYGGMRSTTTNATNSSEWTMTSEYTQKSSALPAGFNANAYGTPPHLRGSSGAASSSIRSDANTSGGGKFAKVRAPDADRRTTTRRTPSAYPVATVPGAQDDDDIGVAADSDDED